MGSKFPCRSFENDQRRERVPPQPQPSAARVNPISLANEGETVKPVANAGAALESRAGSSVENEGGKRVAACVTRRSPVGEEK